MHGTFYTVNSLTSQIRIRFRFVLGRAEVRGRGKDGKKERNRREFRRGKRKLLLVCLH